jgi:hypothetical protein
MCVCSGGRVGPFLSQPLSSEFVGEPIGVCSIWSFRLLTDPDEGWDPQAIDEATSMASVVCSNGSKARMIYCLTLERTSR